MRKAAFLLLLLFASLGLSQEPTETTPDHRPPVLIPSIVGRWDSQLHPMRGDGDVVDFTIAIQMVQRDLRADLLNGPSRIAFSRVLWQDRELVLHLDQYDGTIEARCADKDCNSLAGQYSRQRGEKIVKFKFTAKRHAIELQHPPLAWQWPTIEGDWKFSFDVPESDPDRLARGHFLQGPSEGDERGGADAEVYGTVAPVSGDYGLLHGSIVVDDIDKPGTKIPRFRMTRFDGIHVIVMKGQFLSEGAMVGTISFNFDKPETFQAERLSAAPAPSGTPEVPNPETLTTVSDPKEPFHFAGVDPATGKTVTSDDPRFKGKAVIVDIFGTWCPNCHDEAPLLADLYNRYHAQGLEIVGLAYEYTPDEERSAKLLQLFRQTYAIQFPMLIAGSTDEGQIEKTLPQLQHFSAYPTTIFLDRDGRVHAIHAGFAGPASGNFEEVKTRFEKLVKEIVGPEEPEKH